MARKPLQSLSLALLLFLAMAIVACQEVQTTPTVIVLQQTPESFSDVSPALVKDARSYAEDYGVSLDEAIGRLAGQEAIAGHSIKNYKQARVPHSVAYGYKTSQITGS